LLLLVLVLVLLPLLRPLLVLLLLLVLVLQRQSVLLTDYASILQPTGTIGAWLRFRHLTSTSTVRMYMC
jgi:hypothetical protein